MAVLFKISILILVLVYSVKCHRAVADSLSSEEKFDDKLRNNSKYLLLKSGKLISGYKGNKSKIRFGNSKHHGERLMIDEGSDHVYVNHNFNKNINKVINNDNYVNNENNINSDNDSWPQCVSPEGTTEVNVISTLNDSLIKVIETPEALDRSNDEDNKSPETEEMPIEAHTEREKVEYGGSQSPMKNYTFAVSIQKKNAHYANGVLIDNSWILTTAEDFFNVRESIKLYRARLGSVDCKHGGLLVPIQAIRIHPKFKPGQPNYDLALLKLPYPIERTKFITPIAISNITGHITSAKFLTTYWPRLIIKGNVLAQKAKERVKSHNLRVSTQKLIPHPECKDKLKELNVSLSMSTLCLKPITRHHSACLPDTGAPIIAGDELWGIASGWTWANCTQKPELSPTLFTRLRMRSVMSWINSFLKNNRVL